MFDHITDHVERGLALLPAQFQTTKTRVLLSSWLAEFQEAEDALWDLLEATLDTATGARLDQFAVLLSEPRQGLSNDALRTVLRARIVANRSQGRDGDIAALLALFAVAYAVEDHFPAKVLVTLEEWPGTGLPLRVAGLVRRAVSAGIDLQVVYVPEGDAFTFAEGSEEHEAGTDTGFADLSGVTPVDGGELAGVVH